jgi:hypothetical protein
MIIRFFPAGRQCDDGNLGRGIGVGEASPDGSAIARLAVTDERERLGKKRYVLANNGAPERVRLAGACLHGNDAVGELDAA